MPPEGASTSLIEQLADTGFRSSVISTYTCYFPFYEEVVLRKLVSVGCTHNVLLVDAARCAEAYATEGLRPQRAGRDYTLIPVKVRGAFHPKLFLRLGKSKGSLFVGSHNMTLSGFGLNDEITNTFKVEGASLRSGGGPLRDVLDYLASFLPVGLPDVAEAFAGLKRDVPWIDGPLGSGDAARSIHTSADAGPDLWSQIAPLIPGEVDTAFVCGPFFDRALTLVQRIQSDVRPRELVVGIDPASVELDPQKAAALDGVRWVNVGGIPNIPKRREGAHHYLHAKLFWFRGKTGELLISGSANPSAPAFLATAGARNAEAIVVDRRPGAGLEIGIEALLGAPPISASEWVTVEERMAEKSAATLESGRHLVVATPTSGGFHVGVPLAPETVFQAMGDNGERLGEAIVRDLVGMTIEAADTVRDEARYLEASFAAEHWIVMIHRPAEIADNLGGDTRKALRQALGALEEDPGQLEALLKVTEKVIFDAEDQVRTMAFRSPGAPEPARDPGTGPASLALDAAGRTPVRRKQSLASGDIVVLLDALIRRLGEGLPIGAALRPRTDEEEVDVDEDDGGQLNRIPADHSTLAKACRAKARRMIKRMEGQFVVAAASGNARRAIVQLAAVLAVVRALRIAGQRPEWRKQRLELVGPEDRAHLLEAAVLAGFWGERGLGQQAATEVGGQGFEELSAVVGLLVWLAWDLGIDLEKALRPRGHAGTDMEEMQRFQLLATLGSWFAGDEQAAQVLADGVPRTPRPGVDGDHWLLAHCGLLEAVGRVTGDPDNHGQLGRDPSPGDLVILSEKEAPRVRVILQVRPGTSGAKVVFFDPADEMRERSFLASHVATLSWSRSELGMAV